MRVALDARVSTTRHAQAQGIEQQLDRLRAAAGERGWELDDQYVYRDDGFSGARLGRPGLDRLRDHAALADLDLVLVTAPDRLARNYVHQVLLIDELARCGCQVEFLDRPMSSDPHDQLLLQIRGAVAEYERTLIAERMRRGRQAKLRAGTLLPWTRPPFGYRLDPERPRQASAVRVEPSEVSRTARESLFPQRLVPWRRGPLSFPPLRCGPPAAGAAARFLRCGGSAWSSCASGRTGNCLLVGRSRGDLGIGRRAMEFGWYRHPEMLQKPGEGLVSPGTDVVEIGVTEGRHQVGWQVEADLPGPPPGLGNHDPQWDVEGAGGIDADAALAPDDVGCQVGDALPGAAVQLHQRTGIEGEDVDQAVARCR